MRKSFSSSINADNRLPFFFWKGFALNSSSFSWMALLSSSKVKNFRFLSAARIHVSRTFTVPSAFGLPFLSVITDKKGKPTVENHVRFLETHLVEELKKDTYTSLEALNAAVKKIVADINQRPFQKKSDIKLREPGSGCQYRWWCWCLGLEFFI
ncbi:hypothetical protein [Sellimonas caecigallum]|uniref:hypothetical protein n=1 Tax=Sellimonas caecigallum TaxID=2592333 RepID=UPI001FEAAD6E|nr:hypothetical protein [Sellimonas caecigallum]